MAIKAKRSFLKNVLMIMDPLAKLDLRWDNSLALARELTLGGTQVWTADSTDVRLEGRRVLARARPLKAMRKKTFAPGPLSQRDLSFFELVLLRKEPPFDLNYLYLTFILEKACAQVPVANHPRGVRNASEKLWGHLHTAKVPQTLISSSPQDILDFYRRLKGRMVLKALNEKGGRGIVLVPRHAANVRRLIAKATDGGRRTIACQRFLKASGGVDKRIVLLDGKLLCAFEKRPAAREFRSNLGLGGSAARTRLSGKEKKLVREIAPQLRREGIYLAGLDVMDGKLLEVNVTSPAGMTDAEALYPGGRFIAAWAAWLARFAAARQRAR